MSPLPVTLLKNLPKLETLEIDSSYMSLRDVATMCSSFGYLPNLQEIEVELSILTVYHSLSIFTKEAVMKLPSLKLIMVHNHEEEELFEFEERIYTTEGFCLELEKQFFSLIETKNKNHCPIKVRSAFNYYD